MAKTPEAAGAPRRHEWITPTEAARRLVAESICASMSRQRITQLASGGDPAFPCPREKWRTIGGYTLVPWEPVRAYFQAREPKQGGAGHRAPAGPRITVVVERSGRGSARFASPQEPRLAGVSRWVAHQRYSAETDQVGEQESKYAEASNRQAAIRKIAGELGVHPSRVTFADRA